MVRKIGVLLLAVGFLHACGNPTSFPEPAWVVDIRNRIDADSCGPQNCRACDAESCSVYSDSCTIETARYACGPACDAIISFCVDAGPPETGVDTLCESDDDCWCRSFTGAQFIPGERVPNRCNIETNRCEPCYYE